MTRLRFGPVLGVILLQLLVVLEGRAQQAPAGAGSTPPAKPPPPADATFPLSAYSAVGSDMALGNRLEQMGWTEDQINAFLEGVRAAFHGKPFPLGDDGREVSRRIFEKVAAIEAKEKQDEFAKPGVLKDFLTALCKRLNLQQSDSGLCYAIQPGTMETRPGPDDTVVVSCAAFAADGMTPVPLLTNPKARAKVSDMLPGFVEGIQMMSVGGKAIFVLPPSLSFGTGNWPEGVDRGTPLIFRISLLEVANSGAAR